MHGACKCSARMRSMEERNVPRKSSKAFGSERRELICLKCYRVKGESSKTIIMMYGQADSAPATSQVTHRHLNATMVLAGGHRAEKGERE